MRCIVNSRHLQWLISAICVKKDYTNRCKVCTKPLLGVCMDIVFYQFKEIYKRHGIREKKERIILWLSISSDIKTLRTD